MSMRMASQELASTAANAAGPRLTYAIGGSPT